MNWHTEHHMYAGVPCYNLKALAKEIETDMPEPGSLFSTWKQMRETWRRQKEDPDDAFDTPVPTDANSAGMSADDEIVNSVDDLAPKGSKLL